MLTVALNAGHDSIDASPSDHSARRDLRLLVVDDHPAVRAGVRQLLEDEPDFEVLAVCPSGEGAVAKADQAELDVAIVDYHLGGRNGLWVCRKLKRLARPPRVIVFSAFANDHLAANSVVAGADALLGKGSLGSDLCDTIRLVAHGRRLLPRVGQPMADMLRRRLDDQQQQVFGMLLAGMSASEMQRALGISAGDLESCKAEMLFRLEPLPSEWAERADTYVDYDSSPLPRSRRQSGRAPSPV